MEHTTIQRPQYKAPPPRSAVLSGKSHHLPTGDDFLLNLRKCGEEKKRSKELNICDPVKMWFPAALVCEVPGSPAPLARALGGGNLPRGGCVAFGQCRRRPAGWVECFYAGRLNDTKNTHYCGLENRQRKAVLTPCVHDTK